MKLFTLTLMLAFSILVLAIGMPPLEQSRGEARFAQAYGLAKQIKIGTLPIDTVDPWGTPFRIIRDDRRQIVRVVSLGPNQSTGTNELDADDVESGLLSPPHHTMMRNHLCQLLTALILSATPWLVTLVVLFQSIVRRLRRTASKVNSSQEVDTIT